MRTTGFLLTALLVACATGALAHGGHGQITLQHAVTVTFTGHDGAPLSGLSSRVLYPDGNRYLAGQTDSQGRVVFLPDREGEWTVKAMGEDGHGGTVHVEVGPDLMVVGMADAHTHDHDHGEEAVADHDHDHDHDHVAATGADHDHDPGHMGTEGTGRGLTFASALGYLLGAFGVVALVLSRKRPSA